MTDSDESAVALTTPAVMLHGRALREVYFLAATGLRSVERHCGAKGQVPEPGLRELVESIGRTVAADRAMTRERRDAMTAAIASADSQDSIPIDSSEAGRILGLSKRQTQRIARSLDGTLVGGRWLFDRSTVESYAAQRDADHVA